MIYDKSKCHKQSWLSELVARDEDVERSADWRIEASSVEAVTGDQWHSGPEIIPVSGHYTGTEES